MDDTPPGALQGVQWLRRPRLSDLFLLTLCLSVFMAGCRYAFGSDYNFVLWPLSDVELFGYGVGVACCWTGFLRMLRPGPGRAPLPIAQWQPGEVICCVEGVYYLIVALIGAALRYRLLNGAASLPEDAEEPISLGFAALIYAAPPAVLCFGYIWLARHVTVKVWRWGAIAKAVAHGAIPFVLLAYVTISTSFESDLIIGGTMLGCVILPTLLILLAAWTDRRRTGVHWVHWLGVFAFATIHFARLSVEVRALMDLLQQ